MSGTLGCGAIEQTHHPRITAYVDVEPVVFYLVEAVPADIHGGQSGAPLESIQNDRTANAIATTCHLEPRDRCRGPSP